MPFLLGTGAGLLGGIGTWLGWIEDWGIPGHHTLAALAVGAVLFLIGIIFGLGIFILGDQ